MIIDLANIYRGGEVESIHYGIACLADSKQIIKTWGDANFSCFTRSLIKAVQGRAILNTGLGLESKDLAITVASHQASEEQLAAVQDLLSKYQLSEADLCCGQASRSRGALKSPLHHNCSGKHAAMLAASKAQNWSLDNYFELEHNLQQAVLEELQSLIPQSEIKYAKDGCGVPTFYMSLGEMAQMFAAMIAAERYQEIIEVMNQYPILVGSPKNIDSILMQSYPGKFFAKVGAEGLVVVANIETGQALLLKLIDGSYRARSQIIESLLLSLNWIDQDLGLDNGIYSSPGELVGSIETRKDW